MLSTSLCVGACLRMGVCKCTCRCVGMCTKRVVTATFCALYALSASLSALPDTIHNTVTYYPQLSLSITLCISMFGQLCRGRFRLCMLDNTKSMSSRHGILKRDGTRTRAESPPAPLISLLMPCGCDGNFGFVLGRETVHTCVFTRMYVHVRWI